MFGRGTIPNPWRKTLPYFGTRNRKDLVVDEGTLPPKKSTTTNGPSCVEKNEVDFSQSWQSVTTIGIKTILGARISKARVIAAQAPQYRQHALTSDLLDLANLSLQEEATLATNWIDDRPEGLTLKRLALDTMAKPVMSSSPKNLTADVQHAFDKCESLGSGKQLTLHGNLSAITRIFSPHSAVSSTSFFAENAFPVLCVASGGTLGSDFDIFAASGESTAWVLLWKTRSRPIGVRVCPIAQFDFQHRI